MKALLALLLVTWAQADEKTVPLPSGPNRAKVFLLDGGCVMAYAEGKRFEFSIRLAELRRAPKWSEEDENPPLSIRRAEKIAKGKLKALLVDPENWTRDDIVLKQSGLGDRWFYVVEFTKPVEGDNELQRMRVVVLMDGTVPEPIQSKSP